MTDVDGRISFSKFFESGLFSQFLEKDQTEIFKDDFEEKYVAEGKDLCDSYEELNKHVFIVESGAFELSIFNEESGSKEVIRRVEVQECFYSIFSIADALTGNYHHFPQVCAKALKDSKVSYLPNNRLLDLAMKDKSFAFRLIQSTLSYAQKIKNMIQSISGLGPQIWKRPKSDEKPAETLPFESQSDYVGDHKREQSESSTVMVSTRESVFVIREIKHKSDSESNDEGELCVANSAVGAPMRSDSESDDEGELCVANSAVGAPMRLPSDSENDIQRFMVPSDKSKLLEACKSFMKVLALKGEGYTELLTDYMELYNFPNEHEFSRANQEAIGFMFVVDGTVKVNSGDPTKSDSDKVIEKERGSLLGVYSVITGEAPLYSIKAGESGCTVAILEPENVHKLRKQKHDFVVRLCDYKLRELSPVVRMLDFAVSWRSVKSGNAVKRDKDHILYVIMGRLRKENAPDQPAGTTTSSHRRDFGRGRVVGAEDILYDRKDCITLYAVRDTNVARIPTEICLYLMKQYPEAFFGKIRELLKESSNQSDSNGPQFTGNNISTVACIRLSEDVRLKNFVAALGKALLKQDIHYKMWEEDTSAAPKTMVNIELAKERMQNKMNCLESNNNINFFLTNYPSKDEWSKLIIRQADLIFVVGNFSAGVTSDIDEIFKGQRKEYSADKILVLLHEPNTDGEYEKPKGTAEWLKGTTELSHLHIRCHKNMFVEKDVSHEDLPGATLTPDFYRLARYITGQSYGLVLGGGGARGLAHVGVIENMGKEVNIDMVGGTSMGAFVGASYCMSTNVEELKQQAALFCDGMNSWWKYLDFALPYVACTSGSYFNKLLEKIFGADTQFEDLWIPYFNITTDITKSVKVVNTSGPLWQYVRASMSIAALVPPLCDPKTGHYLLDGGSVDNLPAGEMKHRGCRIVIAVDVGRTEEKEHLNYGHSVSCWWLLLQRYHPWCTSTVPDILSIITRLACISGEEELRRVKANPEYIYARPDSINDFGTLEFEKCDAIIECGRKSGKEVATEFIEKSKVHFK